MTASEVVVAELVEALSVERKQSDTWRRLSSADAAAVKRLSKEMNETRAALEKAEADRSNLLARIHGDGGHYTDAHGTDKAVADAHLVVANLSMTRNDAYSALAAERTARQAAEARVKEIEDHLRTLRIHAECPDSRCIDCRAQILADIERLLG